MTDEREYRREDDGRLERIERAVDRIDAAMTSLQVNVEHRVTKLETRSALFGFLGGVIASTLASIVAGIILAVTLRH